MSRYSVGVIMVLILVMLLSTATEVGSARSIVRVEISTYPVQLPIVVDGIVYVPALGGKHVFYWVKGSVHEVDVLRKVSYVKPGTRLVFSGWNTLGGLDTKLRVKAEKNTSIVGLYETQYLVQVESPYGKPRGSGWYSEGARVNVSVEDVVYLEPGVRAVFKGWNKGSSPSSSSSNYIYVFQPEVLKAEWIIEFSVNISSNSSAGAVIQGSGWYQKGSVARISAQEEVILAPDIRERFEYWRVSSGNLILEDQESRSQLIVVDSPMVLEAIYGTYYRVQLLSPYGTPKGEDYYRAGSTALVSVDSPHDTGNGIRYTLTGWKGDAFYSGNPLRIVVEQPIVLEAVWSREYKVSIDSTVPAVKGEGWYREGEVAVLEAKDRVKARLGIIYIFRGWSGDVDALDNRVSVEVDSPLTVKAVWDRSMMWLYVDAIILVTASILAILGYKKIFSRAPSPSQTSD